MSKFRIEKVAFNESAIQEWATQQSLANNWPAVYLLSNDNAIYVGETLSATSRLNQHLKSGEKLGLNIAHIVLDDTFNKSACLDLESSLIRWFAGDSKAKKIRNRNSGVFDFNYFQRDRYQKLFREIQAELRVLNFFGQSIEEIENSDLFKFSPFKSLNNEQLSQMKKLVLGMVRAVEKGVTDINFVVSGGPGTGKTIFALVLAKYLSDLSEAADLQLEDDFRDTQFGLLANREQRTALRNFSIGLVIPQQALRKTIAKVVRRTTGLKSVDVLSPFDVGKLDKIYDVLIVDESHRLKRRGNSPSGTLNLQWTQINKKLFRKDDPEKTQLDWIRERSKFRVLVLDVNQAVVSSDLSKAETSGLVSDAKRSGRLISLKSQMRVRGGEQFVASVPNWLRGGALNIDAGIPGETGYDFRFFDNLDEMVSLVRDKNREHGLGRLVAGYAWKWVSKSNASRHLYDIEIEGTQLRWNSAKSIDWVTSDHSGASDEVGSIHSIQGYDLNYAGVIIGPELKWDSNAKQIIFNREHYFDSMGMQNLPQIGVQMTNVDLLDYVLNIYNVLLTRGIRGTYVYVCDPELRNQLSGSILMMK